MPFIPFTPAQLHAAKHADLAAFLEARGETLKRSGSELEWADHHVTIRGNQFYDQYEGAGGTAIDFVRKYFDANFPDAVQMLLGQNIAAAPVEPRQREREPFSLPPKNENMRRVYAYLLKQRCIDRAVLDHFAHKHLIYEDSKYHNAVFVGTDEESNPRHAHKRSTASQGSWRANQTGSNAAYAFHHTGTSSVIYAFESPIDLLSFISLYQKDWQQHSYRLRRQDCPADDRLRQSALRRKAPDYIQERAGTGSRNGVILRSVERRRPMVFCALFCSASDVCDGQTHRFMLYLITQLNEMTRGIYMPVNESAKALLKHLSQLADRSAAGGGELHPDLRATINYAASILAAAEGFELNIDDAAMIAEEGPLGLRKFLNKYDV